MGAQAGVEWAMAQGKVAWELRSGVEWELRPGQGAVGMSKAQAGWSGSSGWGGVGDDAKKGGMRAEVWNGVGAAARAGRSWRS